MANNRPTAFHITGISSRTEEFVSKEIHYRGYRIVWDARRAPDMLFWIGKVAVVVPSDMSDGQRVHRIHQSDYFLSQEDARDHLIGAAKNWIDKQYEIPQRDEHKV
jgi:hypothetical protein